MHEKCPRNFRKSVDMDRQWLMFISLSSSSAEKAEKVTGSHSRVHKLTRQTVWVLLKSGTVTKRTSWPSAPAGKRRQMKYTGTLVKRINDIKYENMTQTM